MPFKQPRRVGRATTISWLVVVVAAALLSACQGSGAATAGLATAGPTTGSAAGPATAGPESPSPEPPSPSIAATTSPPTATPLPLALARPEDLPTDGACEPGHTCLGLLSAGPHHTDVFKPGFEFTMPATGWENLSDEGGVFEVLSLDHPGDAISFFRQPRPTTPDGTLVAGIGIKVDAISAWMASNTALTVSPATKVSLGGLNGLWVDFAIAPGTESHPSDCPVQVCVLTFLGKDPSSKPTWGWDWGSAGPERQRLYLLTATDGVVAIFVDSLDGTTFDVLTKAADVILGTVKFDGT